MSEGRVGWLSAGLVLRGDVVERTFVFQPNKGRSLERLLDLVPALLLEDLRDRFELGHALGPIPLRAAETFFELAAETLIVEVVAREVIDGSIAPRLQLHVIEVGIDRGGDV